MGRPERPVDPAGGPVAAFAMDLRELRARAGNPSYRTLSTRAKFSPSVLSAAASGFALPSLQVTLALVEACGGDRDDWTRRWRQVADQDPTHRSRRRLSPVGSAGPDDDAEQWRNTEATPPTPTPAQLPVGPRHFAGRTTEMARISGFVLGPGPGTPLLVSGPIGVGKSALAVHWGHQHEGRFPDGVLYADLAAHRTGRDVLAYFLRALGCQREQLDTSDQNRSALFRSLLATRRVLVLLDNATNEGQVRPLLAGSAGSQVIITSRNRLAGLDGVERLALDVLPMQQSLAVLGAIVGLEQVAAEYERACALADLCDHLPLALWTTAVRVAVRPGWSLGYAVEQLGDEPRRLRYFDSGETGLVGRLRAAYAGLDALSADAYRVVAGARGRGPEAAVLARQMRLSPYRAEDVLEGLVDAGLLIGTTTPGSYRVPGLCQLFAAEVAEQHQATLPFGRARAGLAGGSEAPLGGGDNRHRTALRAG